MLTSVVTSTVALPAYIRMDFAPPKVGVRYYLMDITCVLSRHTRMPGEHGRDIIYPVVQNDLCIVLVKCVNIMACFENLGVGVSCC